MELQRSLASEGDSSILGMLVPSPRSEAVTHELEELSLQSNQGLPPLKERRNVLQLRLQQRRTREQLVEQGIMPPLKTPAAFHEQIRSLERARTENFLKHKIRSRPKRSELVRMHILQETQAEPALQATQMMLKRARLADDLNEKLAQRPGPMELVVKNILPVEPSVKEVIIGADPADSGGNAKSVDESNFDEDSNDALSPEQPASQESQSSSSASPREPRWAEMPSTSPPASCTTQNRPPTSQSPSDFLNPVSTNEQQPNWPNTAPHPISTVAPPKPGPTLVKQSQPKTPSDKCRSKKSKEAKPRVKKLKYHQYIPPDQKQEPHEVPMDSAYARLLQQQQQFLQLQILSQQQQHFNYPAILPAPLKPVEGQSSCSNVALGGGSLSHPIVVSLPSGGPARSNQTPNTRKPGHLPANLDEMKVAELKIELKLRGLPVSGTKTDLIERLKPHQESASSPPGTTLEAIASTGTPRRPGKINCPPSVSPAPADVSSQGTEETAADSQRKITGARSPPQPASSGHSPRRGPQEDGTIGRRASEKDQQLHAKEQQIEVLMRKLEQEQRLVEELKMQLEVGKRGPQGGSPPHASLPVQVKEESGRPSSLHGSPPRSPPSLSAVVKQEEPPAHTQCSLLPRYFPSPQQVPQGPRQALLAAQPRTQIILPLSLPAATGSIQQPSSGGKQPARQTALQSAVGSAASGLLQSPQASQTTEASAAPQNCNSQTQPLAQVIPVCLSPGSGFQFRPGQCQSLTDMPQCFLKTSPETRSSAGATLSQDVPNELTNKSTFVPHQPTFTNHAPKSKDPPRYEEAVKQTRSMQTAVQVPTATSQHMDDLFDVLIESGEISPFSRQDPPALNKLCPVTASVTTLPINTVLSRPPPQIQVARPPAPTLLPPPSLAALATDNQLEAFLEGTLAADEEPQTLRLLEELHSHLLEHPHSPVESMELGFNHNAPPSSSFQLTDTNLDNMEWLDLTMPGPVGGLNPLGLSAPAGVFSTDFLDAQDLQLQWE
ncbi:myocardin-related transcription factor B [Aplochiton taeniatus]